MKPYGKRDPNAIHIDTAGEINQITEKETPADADWIIIEDSADNNNKKKMQIGSIVTTVVTDGTLTGTGVLGDVLSVNVGSTAGSICAGDDSRLSDARTPISHNNTYHTATYITNAGVTYEALSSNGDIGSSTGTVCAGDDSRLSDARTPISHNNTYHSSVFITSTGVTYEVLNANGDIGSSTGTLCAGDDSRLSDNRTDDTAIHDNIAGEIAAIDEKNTPSVSDWIIIEDSADTNKKKKVQAGNLPNAGGGEINTASNVGSTGTGIFKQKATYDLEFYKLNSLSDILSIALDGTDKIDFDVTESNIDLSLCDNVTSAFITASAITRDNLNANGDVGIANNNIVEINSTGVADNDYAKFTASGLEGRSYSEVKQDLSLDSVENTALSTWAGTANIVTVGTIGTGTWQGTTIDHERGGLEADVSAYSGLLKVSGGATSSITDNSTQWDTAFSWGDHSAQNYFDIDTDTLDDIPNGTTYKLLTAIKDGYIDQDVSSTSSPVFSAVNFTNMPIEIGIACSDETTALSTGGAKATFRMPCAMTLTSVRANVATAPTESAIIVDINENGSTIMTTNKLSIDATEKTSTTAETPAGITDTALADDAEITIDITQVGSSGAGAGLKVWLIGTRS